MFANADACLRQDDDDAAHETATIVVGSHTCVHVTCGFWRSTHLTGIVQVESVSMEILSGAIRMKHKKKADGAIMKFARKAEEKFMSRGFHK